jgi:sugar (pentulose or hexulose) kinase
LRLFLGLDFGTTGARACVIEASGAICHEAAHAYPDPAAQQPADWLNALHALFAGLPDRLRSRLDALAIDATSGTVLLCDDALEPVGPALLYHQAGDARALPPGVQAPALARLLRLAALPGAARARHALHQADWLAARLTGIVGVSDYHNALKTGYDVHALCWPDWVTQLPIAPLLPEVRTPGMTLGRVSRHWARYFNLAADCRVRLGTTDSIAAFMAAGVSAPGEAVTSLGSTLVLKLLSNRPVEDAGSGVYRHRYGYYWLAGGASNAGGVVLRQFFSDARLAELSARIDPQTDSALDYLPLPGIGERFPVLDPALPPRLTPRPDDDAVFLHGMLEGLARIEARGYARLTELGADPLQRVVTAGGGAANPVWTALRGRLLGVPVVRANRGEAAWGAAWLAREAGLPGRVCPQA